TRRRRRHSPCRRSSSGHAPPQRPLAAAFLPPIPSSPPPKTMRSFDPQIILREELAELKAYSPAPGNFEVRLDANEAPDMLSPALKKRLNEITSKTSWTKYPDASQKLLRKAIATHLGVKSTQIIAGVGSDELITMLLTAATRLKSKAPAPTLITTTPTFVMYRLSARIRGQRVME